ncbi:MAG: hypothetical protein EXR92_02490, partial [Gemmatimonadetes bacterium]|nr:hypothetical protein [Gemmatimonadota bacterium]
MKGLFSLAVLANAALIFWVELLFGKKLLPALGGSPAMWNTCLMFYQVVLLAGYAYVLLLDRLRPARQLALHAWVLALAVIAVPWSLFLWEAPGEQAPVLWLLGLLTVSVGPPFFALSAGAPLLQRWFSRSEHGDRGDPYFLYAASNLGSFLALGAYPLVIDPFLTLDQQALVWKVSFVGIALLVLACGAAMRGGAAAIAPGSAAPLTPAPLSAERRLSWTVLAFVPSSLLLGVTTHITSEISPVPLLWVVPLGIYLLSFVMAFGPGRHPGRGEGNAVAASGVAGGPPPMSSGAGVGQLEGAAVQTVGKAWKRWAIWATGGVVLAFVGLGLLRGVPEELGWLLIAGDLGVLLVAGLLCHTRLA